MITKEEEKEMNEEMYRFAFGKDRTFFYENNFSTICDFLRENYFCDGLYYRTRLLTTLLHNDALLHPKNIKKNFLEKSEELEKFLKELPI